MEARRKFDQQFKVGAVRIVRETGKPIAQVARDLGDPSGHAGSMGEWGSTSQQAKSLRFEGIAT
ncbi:hypothetical protein LAUMK13_02140 [Mycobacterium innocens]|uniref:Transposase n=1 Tax=Mycobacterium innocens TaxID=2341083 RepID=A0A498Q2J7_9MYCO|nr:hypothetical protein LAUMK13_02140 [Mycobacterium innocens]